MELKELILDLKDFYADKGIDEVKNSARFNALKKVIAFYKKILESNNPEIDEVFKYDKNDIRVAYGNLLQKKLNSAEKQVFNDLYTVYSKVANK